MGVADNKSYKNQYHFTEKYYTTNDSELPSIKGNPKINSTIKENPYRSNVEIEGGELVLTPDLSALFKARGKKHSNGGMDVSLKPNSFIFSDDPKLSFNEKDHKLFELKEGGTFSKSKNTPADVLRRNVDAKHYNTIINNLNDPFKDDLAKKSSAMMLEKYIQTLGNVAFVQEQKKKFPDGLPSFSQGTAPVYNNDLKEEIMNQKQYAKYGGYIGNPVMQGGGTVVSYIDDKGRKIVIGNSKQGNLYIGSINGRPATFDKNALSIGQKMAEQQRLMNSIPQSRNSVPSMIRNSSPNPWEEPKPWLSPNAPVPPVRVAAANTNEGNEIPDLSNPLSGGKIPKGPATAPSTGNLDWGLWPGDRGNAFRTKYGENNEADKISNLDLLADQVGYKGPKNNKDFQKWLYNSSPENRAIIDKWHEKYGDPNITKAENERNKFDGKIGKRWTNALNEIINGRVTSLPQPNRGTPKFTPPKATPVNTVGTPGPSITPIDGTPQGSKIADWQFTPWQKISQLYGLGKYAGAQRYMPYRSRYNASYMDPQLVNPEQTISDVKAGANQQIKALNTLNPILRNAEAANAYGNYLDKVPGIRSQYDAQNAQIANQARQYNNQVRNIETTTNMTNDQNYYTQSVEGRKNFNNYRSVAADGYMNNLLGDVQTNQSLAYNLLTQDDPAYNFNFKTGNFDRTGKNILDVKSGGKGDLLSNYLGLITKDWDNLDNKQRIDLLKIMTARGFEPSPKKKGGKVRNNPYK